MDNHLLPPSHAGDQIGPLYQQRRPWTQADETQASVRVSNFPSGPYHRGTILGCGGWCTVFKVRRVRDGAVAAGKASGDPQTRRKLQVEAKHLKSISHPHILKYIDYHVDASASLVVTELCCGGTLQTKINDSPNGFGRKEALLVILQCSQALKYIHDRNHFHSDVKPRNILIRTWNPVNVVLADWADMKSRMYFGKAAGTIAFWSPDVAKAGLSIGASDDMWALGVTLLGMIGQWPMVDAQKPIREYHAACSTHAHKLLELNQTDKVIRILNLMLEGDLDRRATSSQCIDLTAIALREAEENKDNGVLAIATPPDFQPIMFW